MKKTLTLLLLLLAASPAFAASARDITSGENYFLHTGLCSELKDICYTARVRLPQDYANTSKNYPSLYLLAAPGEAAQWNTAELNANLITVELEPEPASAAPSAVRYAEFMVRELAPYIENNFRAAANSENRIFAASKYDCGITLALLKNHDTFARAALFSPIIARADAENMALNDLSLKLWLDASPLDGASADEDFLTEPVRNLVRLDNALKAGKYAFGRAYLTAFRTEPLTSPGEKAARLKAAMAFLLNAEGFETKTLAALVSSKKSGINRVPKSILFSVRETYTNGYYADRLPTDDTVRVSPPYFGYQGGLLTLRYGANPGPVTVTATIDASTTAAKVAIVPSMPSKYLVNFTVTAPKDTPSGSKLYIAGAGLPNGSAALKRDKKNRRLYRYSGSFAAGTPLSFNFTLGTPDTAEKDADGSPLPPRHLLVTAPASLAFKPARWLSPEQAKAKNLAAQVRLTVPAPASDKNIVSGPIVYTVDKNKAGAAKKFIKGIHAPAAKKTTAPTGKKSPAVSSKKSAENKQSCAASGADSCKAGSGTSGGK